MIFLVFVLLWKASEEKGKKNVKPRLTEDMFRKFHRKKFTTLYQYELWDKKYQLFPLPSLLVHQNENSTCFQKELGIFEA